MNVVRKKLNNARGASMLIALIYLLTALMVGTVVLTAASSNVGRITHNRQDQREYYAVESAMELVKEDISESSFEASYSKKEYDWVTYREKTVDDGKGNMITTEVEESHHTEDPYQKDAAVLINSAILNKQLADFRSLRYSKALVEEVKENVPQMEYELSFNAGVQVPAVSGKLTVSEDYSITVTLAAEGGSNPVTMSWRADAKENIASRQVAHGEKTVTTYIWTTTVTWGEPIITKGVSE